MPNMTLDRDGTFVKIVERTAKCDAYEQAYAWGLSKTITKEDLMYFLKSKIEGHTEWLNSLLVRYNYADQSLEVK